MPTKPVSKLDGNQTLQSGFDDSKQAHRMLNLGQLVPEEFDTMELTYVTVGNGVGEIETTVYKLNTVTVATLTLSYDSSNRLASVTRS